MSGPERKSWSAMLARCHKRTDPSYQHYGGRGIRVCKEWRDPRRGFAAFLACVGSRPSPQYTLGRIDNARGYEPGNVRWETWTEQANNRRGNHLITIDGETRTAAEWARAVGGGMYRQCITNRIAAGWHPTVAVRAPLGLAKSTAHLHLGLEPTRVTPGRAPRTGLPLTSEEWRALLLTPVRRPVRRAVSP